MLLATQFGGIYWDKYDADKTYTIADVEYSGRNLIQRYWSNYASNSYNFITDVNWLKLRSLSLSYDLSRLLLSKQKVIKRLVLRHKHRRGDEGRSLEALLGPQRIYPLLVLPALDIVPLVEDTLAFGKSVIVKYLTHPSDLALNVLDGVGVDMP